jgi:hypothetical protein
MFSLNPPFTLTQVDDERERSLDSLACAAFTHSYFKTMRVLLMLDPRSDGNGARQCQEQRCHEACQRGTSPCPFHRALDSSDRPRNDWISAQEAFQIGSEVSR